METDRESQQIWERRLEAVGKAQTRYLWVLFILGLFFWSLKSSSVQPTAIVPGLAIEIDVAILEAASSSVLFVLVIVVLGSLRAYGAASDEWLELKGAQALTDQEMIVLAEAVDSVPNAIDLAVFTRRRFRRSFYAPLLLVYPGYLTIFTVEGASLWLRLLWELEKIQGWAFFTIGGAILGVSATFLLLKFWRNRLNRIWSQIRGDVRQRA